MFTDRFHAELGLKMSLLSSFYTPCLEWASSVADMWTTTAYALNRSLVHWLHWYPIKLLFYACVYTCWLGHYNQLRAARPLWANRQFSVRYFTRGSDYLRRHRFSSFSGRCPSLILVAMFHPFFSVPEVKTQQDLSFRTASTVSGQTTMNSREGSDHHTNVTTLINSNNWEGLTTVSGFANSSTSARINAVFK